jgi:moderate conductance mechanosensitive channel
MHTFALDSSALSNPVIDWLNLVLPRVPGAVLGLLLGILLVRIVVRLTRWILKLAHTPKGLRQIITSATHTLLWILLLILFLKWAGFADVVVLFSSSALAIGIALAAGGSTLLSDLVAGIFLARDGDFNVGDEVKAGDPQVQGIIESMDVRRVRVRDKAGLLHVLPNSVVERKEWVIVQRKQEITALAKAVETARKLKTKLRKNAQSQ